MDTFESIRSIINTYIKENGAEEISGDILNNVLHSMLDEIDHAIATNRSSGGSSDIPARLTELRDVEINDPTDKESLVYDSELRLWVNKMVAGGGGDAKTEQDVVSEVKVGLLNVGDKISEGTSFTDFLIRLLTASIGKVLPKVTLTGLPETHEVGSNVLLNPTFTFQDGKFTNTYDKDVVAGCTPGEAKVYLNDGEVNLPHQYETNAPIVNKVKVVIPYSASSVKPKTKGGEESDVSIPAGQASTEGKYTTAYKWFIGGLTRTDANALTSQMVRNLSVGGVPTNGYIEPDKSQVTIINKEIITDAGKWIAIAVPEEYSLVKVKETLFGETFHTEFITKNVEVQCAGTQKKKYNVYLYELSPSAGSVSISEIIIGKA